MTNTWLKLDLVRHQVAIAGRVSDQLTGQLIHGATVEIIGMPDSFKAWLALRSMQYGSNWEKMTERPDRTRTAIDGHFHFLDLPDGKYTLKVSLPSAGTRYKEAQKEFQVSRTNEKNQLEVADISLPPTAIKGRITATKDNEVESVKMAKIQVEGSGEFTFSDSEGNYLLSGIEVPKKEPSERSIVVSAKGYKPISKIFRIERGKVENLDDIELTTTN